jgi:hypothetical protein
MSEPPPFDQDAQPLRVHVQPVTGPRDALLELNGTILVYHQNAWSGRVSVFIPVEWIALKATQYVDSRFVYKVMALPAIALLIAMPGVMLAQAFLGPVAQLVGVVIVLGLMMALAAAALGGLVAARKRPAIDLTVESESAPLRIRFWHEPGEDAERDRLVERMQNLSARADEVIAYTIQKSHTWYRIRPFRAAIVKALFFTAILLLPVQIIATVFEQPWVNAALIMPAIVYIGRYALEASLLRFAPQGFREAVNSYHRDELKQAEKYLRTVFDNEPDYLEACLLSIQLSLERRDFGTAFKRCRQVAKSDPELADDIAEEIWLFKRMNDRMRPAT